MLKNQDGHPINNILFKIYCFMVDPSSLSIPEAKSARCHIGTLEYFFLFDLIPHYHDQ